MENNKLNDLIKRQLEVSREIKQLKGRKESLKSEILVELKTNSLENYEDDEGNTATINKYPRTTIDKEKVEKFCEDTGQELSYFQKTIEIEQLKVVAGGEK